MEQPIVGFTPETIDESTIIESSNLMNQLTFNNLLKVLTEYYHNDQSLVSDETYDQLVDIYEAKYERFTPVGAEPRGEKVDLPYYLGSLRKLKKDNELDRWIKSHPGPYILEDKIDGLTLLLVHTIDDYGKGSTKLYTRGGGYRGMDVSHLLNYLNLPQLTLPLAIRGEVVMAKSTFDRVGAGFKNPRNLVSGIINAKKQFKPELAKELSFFAYRIINTDSTPEEQVLYLQRTGFLVPSPAKADVINRKILEHHYKLRTEQAPYEMDGIVIYQNIVDEYPVGEAPRHVVAFKTDTETAETTVTNVVWEPSKNRLLKPIIHYETVNLSGADLAKSTGYNARFIVSNVIGPGARILITRSGDVIPKVLSVITPAPGGPSYPDVAIYGKYGWNDNQVEFVLLEDNDQVLASKLKHFLTTLDVKQVGPKRIESMVAAGIKDIKSLLTTTPQQFAAIPGIGPGLSSKIYADLHDKVTGVRLATIMDASGIFPNIGERRLEMILETYPNLLELSMTDPAILTRSIQQIKGFDKMASTIVEKLPIFVEWLGSIPEIQIETPGVVAPIQQQPLALTTLTQPAITQPAITQPAMVIRTATAQPAMVIQPATIQPTIVQPAMKSLENTTVVFSGFRDKDLEREITSRGGRVSTSVSGRTSFVIMKDVTDKKGKALEAERKGVPLISKEEFTAVYL